MLQDVESCFNGRELSRRKDDHVLDLLLLCRLAFALFRLSHGWNGHSRHRYIEVDVHFDLVGVLLKV